MYLKLLQEGNIKNPTHQNEPTRRNNTMVIDSTRMRSMVMLPELKDTLTKRWWIQWVKVKP